MLPSGIFNVKLEEDVAILRTKTQWVLLGIGFIFLFSLPLYLSDYWVRWLVLCGISGVAVLHRSSCFHGSRCLHGSYLHH